jgi:hypothetical protein
LLCADGARNPRKDRRWRIPGACRQARLELGNSQFVISTEPVDIFGTQLFSGLLASPNHFSDDAYHIVYAYAVLLKVRIRAAPRDTSLLKVMRTHGCYAPFKVSISPENIFEFPWLHLCLNA